VDRKAVAHKSERALSLRSSRRSDSFLIMSLPR
jgi:hypothetical protein